MKEKLTTVYENLAALDCSVIVLNKDLKNVQKCREAINSSSNLSDVCEDYLRLSKEEIGAIYQKASTILDTLLNNIETLKLIPKTHWYTAAIAFIISAYDTNGDLEESIKLYDNSISSLLSENTDTNNDILTTIEESQNNAIERTSFIKSLLNRNEEYGILVPEIKKIQLPEAGDKEEQKPVIEEGTEEKEIKEEKHRKTIFEVLRTNRGQ